ncbi:hypothetical protein BJ875DRAFT_454017, partial [Amylocarpus encephaloides]
MCWPARVTVVSLVASLWGCPLRCNVYFPTLCALSQYLEIGRSPICIARRYVHLQDREAATLDPSGVKRALDLNMSCLFAPRCLSPQIFS